MLLKLFLLAAVVAVASGHGYLKRPLARTAIHTVPELNPDPPYWWDYHGVWCGNVQQDRQYTTCGRCGDAPGETGANQGGEFDKGIITATYQAGQIIEIEAEIGAAHFGHFELELCPQVEETDDCFEKLPILAASQEVRDGNRVCVPYDGNQEGSLFVTAQVWLPVGVTCERCTLRWTYRTSYMGRPDWDLCDNWNPAQTFRNCADVKIV